MKPLLELNNLTVSFAATPVIKNLSLTVRKGEILGIVGESGCGKSTLLQAIMGLSGNFAVINSGKILLNGENIAELSVDERRRLRGPAIAMIFQNAAASFCPVRTFGDQIYESIAQHQTISRQAVRDNAVELLKKLNFSAPAEILDAYPCMLSGGMNQRVAILSAMLQKPALLLADEPTSALDLTSQKQVLNSLLQLRALANSAIILVTHNIGVARHIADTIAIIHQGQIVEYAAAKTLLTNPKHPHTKTLLAAIPSLRR